MACPTILALGALATGSAASGADAGARPASQGDEIVVVVGDRWSVAPLLELDALGIDAFGANSLAELLDALSAHTGSGRGGSDPLILVDGRPVTDLSEVRDLPPEAILRMQILPEEAGLRFGGAAGRRVVNLLMRKSLQQFTQKAQGSLASRGGWSGSELNAGILRVNDGGRWQLSGGYARHSSLLESERGIEYEGGGAVDLANFRALVPKQDKANLSALWTGSIGQFRTSVRASAELLSRDALVGFAPDGNAGLRRRTRSIGGGGGAKLEYDIGSWRWSAEASYARSNTEIRSNPAAGQLQADSVSDTAGFDFIANGPLLRLPAGDAKLTVKGGFERRRLNSTTRFAGEVGDLDLGRSKPSLRASLMLPITSGGEARALGGLSANVSGAVARLSDFGTLRSFGLGLRWSRAGKAMLGAAFSHDDGAPTMQQLGDPLLIAQAAPVHDLRSGGTAFAELVEGGNPGLRVASRQLFSLEGSVRPFGFALALEGRFMATRIRNPIMSVPAATTALETTLPGRFVRDADGTLLRVDMRPLNLARLSQTELRYGLSYDKATSAAGLRLQLALHHSWTINNQAEFAPGAGSIEGWAGRPRHLLELKANASTVSMGARVSASWQSPTRLGGMPSVPGLPLSDLTRINFRLFADLVPRAAPVRPPWAKGVKLSLDVDNLLDDRVRVNASDGPSFLAFHPAFHDPIGRSIRITLRRSTGR